MPGDRESVTGLGGRSARCVCLFEDEIRSLDPTDRRPIGAQRFGQPLEEFMTKT